MVIHVKGNNKMIKSCGHRCEERHVWLLILKTQGALNCRFQQCTRILVVPEPVLFKLWKTESENYISLSLMLFPHVEIM